MSIRKKRYFKLAQSTAEYAALLGIIIAAVLAMQLYVKRSLQGKMASTTDYMTKQTGSIAGATIGTRNQYEPYYLKSAQEKSSQDMNSGRNLEIQAMEGRKGNEFKNVTSNRNAQDATHIVEFNDFSTT